MSLSYGFLGNQVVELFLRDHAIAVGIGTLDHLLEHVVVGQLTEVLGHLAEVLEGDES